MAMRARRTRRSARNTISTETRGYGGKEINVNSSGKTYKSSVSPCLRVSVLILSRDLRHLRDLCSQRGDDNVVNLLRPLVTVARFDRVEAFVSEIVLEVLDCCRQIPARIDARVHRAGVIGEQHFQALMQ